MLILSMISEIATFFVLKESNPHIILHGKRNRLQKLTDTPLITEHEVRAELSLSSFYELMLSIIRPWKVIKITIPV